MTRELSPILCPKVADPILACETRPKRISDMAGYSNVSEATQARSQSRIHLSFSGSVSQDQSSVDIRHVRFGKLGNLRRKSDCLVTRQHQPPQSPTFTLTLALLKSSSSLLCHLQPALSVARLSFSPVLVPSAGSQY
jgi:hypothetical protein